MRLGELTRTTVRKKKRIGRGYGSGKGGHTVGKGAKGEKVRGKINQFFLGTKNKKSFFQRLPAWRGKGKLKSLKKEISVVNVGSLNVFKTGTVVDAEALVKKGLIRGGGRVKILGNGDLSVAIKTPLPVSRLAKEKIEKVSPKS